MGVMPEKELKLEETEASHTLGGAEEGRVHGRGKGIVRTCSCAVRLYACLIFVRLFFACEYSRIAVLRRHSSLLSSR